MMSLQPLAKPSRSKHAPQGVLYLLRHGAVQSPEGSKCYIGWKDLALNEAGRRQAGQWADYFAGLALEDIYCSDLVRCLETARMIGAACRIEPKGLAHMREIYLGEWEGQSFETVRTRYPRAFQERGDKIADHRPPGGGESFRELRDRVWPVFEGIARGLSGKVLLVTHAGVIRVLLCRILGMPLKNLFHIGQAHGALNIIAVRAGGYRVHALNLPAPGNSPASGPDGASGLPGTMP